MKNKKIKLWIKAAGIRALKTAAQTAVALLPIATAITQINWLEVAGTAVLAGIISLLTSVAGLPEINNESEEEKYE